MKSKGKPFGMKVVAKESPMGAAYKKAMGKQEEPTPAQSDPGMYRPAPSSGTSSKKDPGMLPPKTGKTKKSKTRTDRKL